MWQFLSGVQEIFVCGHFLQSVSFSINSSNLIYRNSIRLYSPKDWCDSSVSDSDFSTLDRVTCMILVTGRL